MPQKINNPRSTHSTTQKSSSSNTHAYISYLPLIARVNTPTFAAVRLPINLALFIYMMYIHTHREISFAFPRTIKGRNDRRLIFIGPPRSLSSLIFYRRETCCRTWPINSGHVRADANRRRRGWMDGWVYMWSTWHRVDGIYPLVADAAAVGLVVRMFRDFVEFLYACLV